MSLSASSIGLRAAWSCARKASDFSRNWSSNEGLNESAMFVDVCMRCPGGVRIGFYDDSMRSRPLDDDLPLSHMQRPCPRPIPRVLQRADRRHRPKVYARRVTELPD